MNDASIMNQSCLAHHLHDSQAIPCHCLDVKQAFLFHLPNVPKVIFIILWGFDGQMISFLLNAMVKLDGHLQGLELERTAEYNHI